MVLDRVNKTLKLIKLFDAFPNQQKYTLKRIKHNMDIIEKNMEKQGGISVKQVGLSNIEWVTKGVDDIKSFLNAKEDLLDQAQAEAELRKARRKPKPVVAKDLDTDEIIEYKSIHEAHKDLGVNPGQIKMCCEGKNNVKTGLSKKNGKRYTFYYYAFH